MRVLLLADESFVLRERLMLGRLEIGLADEGIRPIRAAPKLATPIKPTGFSEMLTYNPLGSFLGLRHTSPLVATSRILGVANESRRLAEQLREMAPSDANTPLDVIHAFGDGCWSLAIETAVMVGARIMLDVWSAALIPRLRAYEKELERSAEPSMMVWSAPNDAIRGALQREGLHCAAVSTHWGVHAIDEPTAWPFTDRPPCLVIVCSGEDTDGLIAALHGVAAAVRTLEDALVFLDAAAMRDHHRVWSVIEELKLAQRLSLISDMESRRELALRADVLIQPEARGDQRTIILDAMAAGMSVVALEDEFAEELIDGETAFLVREATAEAWTTTLHAVLSDRDRARRVGAAAHEWIKQNRRASRHVAEVLAAYESITSAAPIPFPSGEGAAGGAG